jgi:hypothetical protein
MATPRRLGGCVPSLKVASRRKAINRIHMPTKIVKVISNKSDMTDPILLNYPG